MVSSVPGRRGVTRPSSEVLTLLLSLCAAIAIVGCDKRDVREWQPSDHDQPPGQQAGQVAPRPASTGEQGNQELVEIAWQRNCATCHGQRGRGDGPQGPMVRAPDLTRAEWQSRVGDAEIVEVIRKGRNRMPPFANLPDQVITGLVGRIRANRSKD
ncbi:c-type cytochrome [Polyangium aurulentum]|uniref:c-type cytochrome n=1 Tax=Polyangium aurulentum TaxID=2567896 RepID=UPI0010ADB663|nr:cytochrome c [Polyangium aurulentum]UQA56528.1 cytochrome c [Polyangium aurulentum]